MVSFDVNTFPSVFVIRNLLAEREVFLDNMETTSEIGAPWNVDRFLGSDLIFGPLVVSVTLTIESEDILYTSLFLVDTQDRVEWEYLRSVYNSSIVVGPRFGESDLLRDEFQVKYEHDTIYKVYDTIDPLACAGMCWNGCNKHKRSPAITVSQIWSQLSLILSLCSCNPD